MINEMWNWLKGLFSTKAVLKAETERLRTSRESNITRQDGLPQTKEKDMQEENTDLQKVAEAVKSKVDKDSTPVVTLPTFAISVPAGTMNRKMRRFLLSMGWGNANGDIMAPRKTTKELWYAIRSLMNDKKYSKTEKRKLFKQSFGA